MVVAAVSDTWAGVMVWSMMLEEASGALNHNHCRGV